MKARNWLACVLLCGGLLSSSCERQASAATQLIVTIGAEPALASRLKRVSAVVLRSNAKTRTGREPKYEFSFVDDVSGATRVSLPFSFGVSKGQAKSFLLIVEGYDSTYAKAPAVIERKLIASFELGVTRQLNVQLLDACFNNLCESLSATCAASGCVDIETGSGSGPSTSLADAAVAMDASVLTEAGADSQVDPLPAADAAVDGGHKPRSNSAERNADDADGGSPESVCTRRDVCSPDYPCIETRSGGYTCQGHMADWPMPSTAAGAKVAPSYDYASKPGVVIDRVTQLQWQRDIPKNYPGCSGKAKQQGDTCTWAEAKNYCQQLELDGAGWRLPSKIELESLVTNVSETSAFTPEAFPGVTMDHMFWTRSPDHGLAGWMWMVMGALGGASISSDPLSPNHTRCVRGGALPDGTPNDRYVHDASAGTLTDSRTRLVWQRDFGDAKTIEAARALCTSRGEGWRLPGHTELLTLVDPTRSEPALDPNNFPGLGREEIFWTSTQAVFFENDPPQYILVEFADGSSLGETILREANADNAYSLRVRCVR